MNRGIWKRLLRYAKPYAGYFVLALLSAAAGVALSLYVPILTGGAIDHILGKGLVDFGGLVPYLNRIALATAGAAMFQWSAGYCTARLTYKTVRSLRDTVFGKLEVLPLSAIDAAPHGDRISRMVNDVDQISDGLLQGFTQLFSGVVTILGTIGFMLAIDVPITLVVVLLTPLSLFVASFIARRSFHMFREQARVKGELAGCVEEMVGGMPVVKAFGHEDWAQAQFEEINGRLYDCGVKAQFYSSLTNPCTRFVNSMVYAAVGIVGALGLAGAIPALAQGGLTVGLLASFLQYANQYTKPFNEISGVVTELQGALASARRIFQVLDEPSEVPDAPDAITLEEAKGHVQLEGVCFSYDKQKPLIENLNLTALPGRRIAIVGPTGCGKTTIINLLMRFYDPDAGAIRVDGREVRAITRSSLRKQYGMVLQDTWLFAGSIRENIAYGRPDATEEEIVEAARLAHAHGFIRRLPAGYDTRVGEEGDSLSQGQKQLLCIARVMLTRPPMLILDEATSSIDTRTELQIQKAFRALMEGRTSFIVAHRLSTIQSADCILVMDAGRIVETGRHDELLAKGGFYARLYHSQYEN